MSALTERVAAHLRAEDIAEPGRAKAHRERLGNAAAYLGAAGLVSFAAAQAYGPAAVVVEALALAGGAYAYERIGTPKAGRAPSTTPPAPAADTVVLAVQESPQPPAGAVDLPWAVAESTRYTIASQTPWEVSDAGTMRCTAVLGGVTPAVELVSRQLAVAAALGVSTYQLRMVADPHRRNAREIGVTLFTASPWDRPITTLGEPVARSVFDGVEIGVDVDGNPFTINVIGRSILIGGVPDSGKTVTAMTILAQLARDPFARLWVADPKGVDMPALIPICYRYVGRSQQGCLEMLDDLYALGQRKLDALREAGVEKLTREVVSAYAKIDPAHLLAGVDFVYLDEISEYTAGPDSAVSKEITSRLTAIIQLYRCAGIHLIMATQRPSAQVVDTSVRDLTKIRIAHECGGSTQSNMILGDGAAGNGYSAKSISDAPGVAWVYRAGEFTEVRMHYTDPPALDRFSEFGADVREAAGTMPERLDASSLTEMPLLLSEVMAVFEALDAPRLSTADIITELRHRGTFPVMTARMLAQRMSGFGATPRPLGAYGDSGTNVRGYRRADVEAAHARVADAIAASTA